MFVKVFNTSNNFFRAVSVDTVDPVQAVALARLQCPEGSRFEAVNGSAADRMKASAGNSPAAYCPIRILR
jgi:hypothetical protein